MRRLQVHFQQGTGSTPVPDPHGTAPPDITLGGGRLFEKLDLAEAYQQLVVDEEAAEAQTITTHRGAFRVKRLRFGVNVALGIFQSFMDDLLKGITGVVS